MEAVQLISIHCWRKKFQEFLVTILERYQLGIYFQLFITNNKYILIQLHRALCFLFLQKFLPKKNVILSKSYPILIDKIWSIS